MADNNSKKSSSFSSSSDFSKMSEANTASRTNSVGSSASISQSVERSRSVANVAVAEGGVGIGGTLASSGGSSERGYATQSSVNSKVGYTERGALSDSAETSRSISRGEGFGSSVSSGTDLIKISSIESSVSNSLSAGSSVSSTEQTTSGAGFKVDASKSLSSSSVTTSSISEVSFDPETGTKFERTYSESSDGTISLRLVKEDQISESVDGVLKSQIESSVSVISVSADLIQKNTYIDRISETTDSFGNKSSNQSIETISSEVVRNPSVSEIGAAFNQIEGIRRELAGDQPELKGYGTSSYAESSSRSMSAMESISVSTSKSLSDSNSISASKGLDLDR